ncbi:hypothetical protein [Synechococcus sp. CCY 0621]|uniref:hypothetical protein n=1 Tax=Synechococcus sp. CCY 0621 TaxID=2815603 RepID=UPI001C223028|nr:hypothetical protein [Synechococcus sp. CCY 0621]
MNAPPLTVRRATHADLTVLARFGFALGQLHVGFDGARFAVPPGAVARAPVRRSSGRSSSVRRSCC